MFKCYKATLKKLCRATFMSDASDGDLYARKLLWPLCEKLNGQLNILLKQGKTWVLVGAFHIVLGLSFARRSCFQYFMANFFGNVTMTPFWSPKWHEAHGKLAGWVLVILFFIIFLISHNVVQVLNILQHYLPGNLLCWSSFLCLRGRYVIISL